MIITIDFTRFISRDIINQYYLKILISLIKNTI